METMYVVLIASSLAAVGSLVAMIYSLRARSHYSKPANRARAGSVQGGSVRGSAIGDGAIASGGDIGHRVEIAQVRLIEASGADSVQSMNSSNPVEEDDL
ncbi:hypothetical protein ACWGKK_08685 [Streptomyces chartreusis]